MLILLIPGILAAAHASERIGQLGQAGRCRSGRIVTDLRDLKDEVLKIGKNVRILAEDRFQISRVFIILCDIPLVIDHDAVEDALADAQNKDMKVVNLMDVLGDSVKVEELKEGMQESEHEHDHEHEEDDDHDEDKDHEHEEDEHDHDEDKDLDEDDHDHDHEDGEEEYDEHVWLSVKNAKVLCAEIEKNIEAIDPANASDYKANLESYTEELTSLDDKFYDLIEASSVKTLVFGDRFPFRYFTDDYGLDYYAAFIGCSAETEASFETIAFLSDKIKELDCSTVFTLENSSKDIANTIISTSGKKADIVELYSLQSVSKEDIAGGASYISLMQKNYDVLAGVMK